MRTLIGLSFLFLLSTSNKAQDIFLSTLNNQLYSLDLSDCSYQQIGAMPVSSTDISFHPNGNLYCVTSTGQLYQINPLTGASTFLHMFEPGASQLYTALTISAEGIFYVCGLGGDLWRYDLVSDAGTFIGNVGYGAEGDLTFYDGELYMASENDNIVQVDLQVPSNSTIAVDGNVPGRIFGIVSFAESCDEISVYALTDNAANVYEVNFADSSLDFYCSIPLQVSGGASTFEFLGSNPVYIDEVEVDGFNCANNDGTISITASGGVGALIYSLDGIDFQASPNFVNLPLTTYTIYVADEVGCIRTQELIPSADVPVFNEVRITNTTCGLVNGQIEVMVSGGLEPYTFFVNGMQSSSLTVTDLPAGNYQLEIIDAAGCTAMTQANLGGAGVPVISNINIVSTTCGEDNGFLSFAVTAGLMPFQFSLNGGPVQNSGNFSGLAPGLYTLNLVDQAGCTATASATILPSGIFEIVEVLVADATCGEENGRIELVATGGIPPYAYELNDLGNVSTPIFTDLASGVYTVRAEDASGCFAETTVSLANTPPVSIVLQNQRSASCLEEDGEILLTFSGGEGPLRLTQNGILIGTEGKISALAAGTYEYVLSDSLGCTDRLMVTLGAGNCPFYFPNIFSPNLDGVNDFFAPKGVSISDTQILRLQIYDRWGGLVFEQGSGLLGDDKYRWDGRRLGEDLTQGIYVYFMEVQYADGTTEVFSGDVMLVR
ncbi:gliding motility-associated C-terminal domain-containing protein [Lewinella sp. LCG006]|uniref:T9SS type B sorting domain-containing protein n=1 Tax=Lewinella sp. LCG006 TaxID=3231911 RepID=UPI003460C924